MDIPCFCYHEGLRIAGNCRMCLVKIQGSKVLVPSCSVSVCSEMVVYSVSYRIRRLRENVLEFLLINHPLDCPICDQGGECDLQNIVVRFYCGSSGRRYESVKRSVGALEEHFVFGGLVKTIMTRCIHCTRCVRFVEVISGSFGFSLIGRNCLNEIGLGTHDWCTIDAELSGNVVDLCPVGGLIKEAQVPSCLKGGFSRLLGYVGLLPGPPVPPNLNRPGGDLRWVDVLRRVEDPAPRPKPAN